MKSFKDFISEKKLSPAQLKHMDVDDDNDIDAKDLAAIRDKKKKSAMQQKSLETESVDIKHVAEEVEQVDELKKSTLSSYIQKAADPTRKKSNVNLASKAAYKLAKSDNLTAGEKEDRKAYKRSKGIQTAAKKLAKEEVEQIDENTFEVKYAERKSGPIKVSKFSKLEDAKEFLATVKAAGSNGIISKGGKPVKEEMDAAAKAKRLNMIRKAHQNVQKKEKKAVSAAKRAAMSDMKQKGAQKGMAKVKSYRYKPTDPTAPIKDRNVKSYIGDMDK